jgi:hypothetical protein
VCCSPLLGDAMIYDANKREAINDINVDRGRWLRVRSLPHNATRHEIDDVLEETMPIWDALETECVAGCCGIDAFCFWPDELGNSIAKLPGVPVVPALLRLRDALAGDDDDVLVSTRLNALFVRSSFVQLVDVLLAGYSRVR